ncbi:acyltransferase [Vagococcus lutrae]|uniref:acyltransferase n=1 Tax=Vagococcus lutrae TaxID=81947 RepID=UPI002A82C891|nr:acyltransferase [Vagococcus lutrae]MDY3706229.1 acyltransferase [Vagococcus lutrae]
MLRELIFKMSNRFATPKKRTDLYRRYYKMKIGKNSEIYEDVSFGSEPYLVEVGESVRISKGVKITTHDGGLWVLRNKYALSNVGVFSRVKIESNVHIGINSIIMPGVTIGENVIIGAGSIVTKNLESNGVYAGVPAKKINTIDNYFAKKKKNMIAIENNTTKREVILSAIGEKNENTKIFAKGNDTV